MIENTRKKNELMTIVAKELHGHHHLYLELQTQQPYVSVLPGQFVQVRIQNNAEVFLRRPFSVHDWDEKNGKLSLWIKIIGKGTHSLSEMEVGQTLDIIYPLGNSFAIPDKKEGVLLVGGGCGAAPLLYLARYLKAVGVHSEIILGARRASEFLHPEKYLQLGNVHYMTEDGSAGIKGLVTQHPLLNERIHEISHIIACGPDQMMKAVGRIAEKENLPCQVSLEHMMACGIGACLCCVVTTHQGNVCTCTEGPVFFTHQLKNWL